MKKTDLSRRDFTQLSAAAFGGIVAGTVAGCSDSTPTEQGQPQPDTPASGDGGSETGNEPVVHACRGMNECKGQGAGGDNDCAGMGLCATASIHHTCHGKNSCKGLGGCGANPGTNDCQGMGGCSVPMHAGAWETARAAFEKRMTEAGKEFGDAPPRPQKPEEKAAPPEEPVVPESDVDDKIDETVNETTEEPAAK